jgi:rod shape-determining protein MreC
MQRLINIIVQFKEYFILTLLVVISFVLLASNDTKQIKAIRSSSVGFIGLVQNTMAIIPNVFELQQENELLRKLNVSLSDEINRLRGAKIENEQLRKMLEFKEKSQYQLVPAHVVGKSLHLLKNTITLNAGEKDGVQVDMPVISEQGIVGRIVVTSSNYSIGQLILNKDFRTSVKIQRSRVDGILAWDGGDYLLMKNVSKKQDVLPGDLVITSEYSRVFPPDIKVGVVAEVSENAVSLFKDIKITPIVNLTKLEQVFVIKATIDTQRVAIESRLKKKK